MLTNTERQQIVEEVNAGTYGIDEALDDIAAAQKGEEVRKALYAEALVLNREGHAGSTDMIARQKIANLQTSVNGQISTLRTEVGDDIDDLETALNSGLAAQNGKIAAQDATIANVVANYNVEYGSTELWASTGETGALAAGTTVTLSEDVSHFDYIDIYSFCGNSNVLDTVPVDAKLQSSQGYALRWVNLSDPDSGSYKAYVRIIETRLHIIGTTLTIDHQVTYRNGEEVNISGAEITQSNRSTYVGELGIMKVVGRKITANTEVTDIRVGADGTEYASAGQAVRTQVNDLHDDVSDLTEVLNDYNSYDIIHRIGTFTDRTSASVTYTWNADKTQCTVNGTATDGFSINNLYHSDNIPMPPGMVAGETYPVLFETTNSNIKLELRHYLNGATEGVPTIIEHTSDYTVPNNCTKLSIRLRVNQNTDGTGVVKKVGILNTESNEILMSEINNLSGVSNLYKSSYLYNVQPNGNLAVAKRALSAAVEINGNGIVYVKKLPSNLHYTICTYSTNVPSSYIHYYPDENWHEIETFIVNDPTAKYIRLYFGKKDNTEINDTDFEDAEIAVYNNIVTPVYYTGDTAQDNGARAIVNNIRKTIKICSWNTGLWNNGITQYMTASNKYKWMRVFGEIDADIIMTQESPYTVVSGNTVAYPDLFGYKYDYLQTPLSSETVYLSKGIASTFPLANLSRHYFSDNQRTYIKSYIIIDDTVICLINAHLSYEAAVRPDEISELIAVMNDEEYVIVCGDFNVEALSEFDAFTAEGYKLANGGDFGEYITWPHTTEASPNGVLDNCIVSSNIKIQNAKVVDSTGTNGISDHKAFIAELRII